MWRGLPRLWHEEDLVAALSKMGCPDAQYVYLPPVPWPKQRSCFKRGRAPLRQKNHGYAFVHFATVDAADHFTRRAEDFATGRLGDLLGESVVGMWASVAVLQGLANNLVNLTASPGRKARLRTDRFTSCVYLLLDGQFKAIPKADLRKLRELGA
jgi:hypothetical protein